MVCEPHLVLLALPRTLVPVVSLAPALTGGQHHTIAVRISVTAAGPLMLLLTTPAPCGHNLLRSELHRYLRPVPDLHLRGMLHLHARMLHLVCCDACTGTGVIGIAVSHRLSMSIKSHSHAGDNTALDGRSPVASESARTQLSTHSTQTTSRSDNNTHLAVKFIP